MIKLDKKKEKRYMGAKINWEGNGLYSFNQTFGIYVKYTTLAMVKNSVKRFGSGIKIIFIEKSQLDKQGAMK